jgi:hypothetical protein
MSISVSMNTQKLPWHRPRIVEDTMLCPDAGQLSLSTSNPGNPHNGYKVRNHNLLKAEQNNARVKKCNAGKKNKNPITKKTDRRRCYRVYMLDSDVIALLDDVELKQDYHQLTPRELREHFDQQWIKMVEGVIEQAALSTIEKIRRRAK